MDSSAAFCSIIDKLGFVHAIGRVREVDPTGKAQCLFLFDFTLISYFPRPHLLNFHLLYSHLL